MEIRTRARPFGVVIAPTESCQTLTPEAAERLAAELIRCAYDSRKLSPCPPYNGAPDSTIRPGVAAPVL